MVTKIKNKCAKTTVSVSLNFIILFPRSPTFQKSFIVADYFTLLFLFIFGHWVDGIIRYRLNSTSDEYDDDDDYPFYEDYNQHMQYRDGLQEFPGRIPPRKKRESTEANTPPRKSRVSFVQT